MPEFIAKPLRFTAEQWPGCGLEALRDLVGEDRLIQAKDETLYVIVSSGHPVRVSPGWWVRKLPDGWVGVAAPDVSEDWDFL